VAVKVRVVRCDTTVFVCLKYRFSVILPPLEQSEAKQTRKSKDKGKDRLGCSAEQYPRNAQCAQRSIQRECSCGGYHGIK
jgi:hypothetical protein